MGGRIKGNTLSGLSFIISIYVVLSLIVIVSCSNSFMEGIEAKIEIDILGLQHRVTYDGNGYNNGTVPSDNNTYLNGAEVSIMDSGTLARTGYAFNNWNTASDGSGFEYVVNGTLIMSSANVILFAQWLEYNFAIGDTGPAGGIIFYDKGSYSDDWRFLEAAPSDQGTGVQWYNGTSMMIGTLIGYGTGLSNTMAISAAQGSGAYAARLCFDLELGGYDDWFLPSKDEINFMALQRTAIGGFLTDYYWSSSEMVGTPAETTARAYVQYFSNAGTYTQAAYKYSPWNVRAIRSF